MPKNSHKSCSNWISQKAFDSVNWIFLLEVMERLGFGRIWRDIIAGLLTTSSTQLLLNGVLGNFINHQQGLRQGDLLSPMLFIIIMDMLNHLISKAAEAGLLQPLPSRSIQHWVSLYADDVVLFLRPHKVASISYWQFFACSVKL
jgi:hypothetical protein